MMIVCDRISKSFGNTMVLEEATFTLEEGKVSVLLGKSGVGKTTLLRCLALLDPPDRGTLTIDGTAFRFPGKQHLGVIYPKLTVVFQQLFLWPHLTNRENILLATGNAHKQQEKDLEELAHFLDIRKSLNLYPNQSSLGQKQRVAIARALILKPKYLLLDEITSSIDIFQSQKIASYLTNLKQGGLSIFFITHNLTIAQSIGDHFFLLHNGKVTETNINDFINDKI